MTKHVWLTWAIVVTGCAADSLPTEEGERDPDLICGDRTVASAFAPSGNRVVFCVGDEFDVIAEGGAAEPMPQHHGCGLDTFLELTDPETAVPAALVRACAARTGIAQVIDREIVDGPVFAPPSAGALERSSLSEGFNLDYCGSDGQANFSYNQAYGCYGAPYCVTWNRNYPVTADSRTMWSTLGEAGNVAQSTVASCNGSTRFRGMRDRGAVDASWVTLYDVDVLPGTIWVIYMEYYGAYGDANFQFRTSSYDAAWHRHSGLFRDQK